MTNPLPGTEVYKRTKGAGSTLAAEMPAQEKRSTSALPVIMIRTAKRHALIPPKQCFQQPEDHNQPEWPVLSTQGMQSLLSCLESCSRDQPNHNPRESQSNWGIELG